MQGDSQLVRSSQGEGVSLKDTSTLTARRSRGSNQQPCGYLAADPLYLLSYCMLGFLLKYADSGVEPRTFQLGVEPLSPVT